MESIAANITDKNTSRIFEHVFSNAFGNPIIFSVAPTLAQMKANTWGIYGTTLYIKFGNNSGISIAGIALA